MATAFFTAVISFVCTNIDGIFILIILYGQAQKSNGLMRIIAGQYIGIGFLTGLSILGAMGAQMVSSRYIGLLGLLPLFLGIRSWFSYRRRKGDPDQEKKIETRVNLMGVAMLTIANGADNIGAYISVFTGYSFLEYAITLMVFAGMTILWCCLGLVLANYPLIKKRIIQYQHILVPLVLMVFGLLILAKNNIL